jgi:hypothetical protein
MPLLPREAYGRLLACRPGSTELYYILGLEPASPAQLLRQQLLPRMAALPAVAAAQLLGFLSSNWASMKVGGFHLLCFWFLRHWRQSRLLLSCSNLGLHRPMCRR